MRWYHAVHAPNGSSFVHRHKPNHIDKRHIAHRVSVVNWSEQKPSVSMLVHVSASQSTDFSSQRSCFLSANVRYMRWAKNSICPSKRLPIRWISRHKPSKIISVHHWNSCERKCQPKLLVSPLYSNKAEIPAIFSLTPSHFVEWIEGNKASPLAPPRRGRGVITPWNGGSCFGVSLGWRCCC